VIVTLTITYKFELKRLGAKMIDFIGGRTRARTWDPLIKSYVGIVSLSL
jgi:hypothetical protein